MVNFQDFRIWDFEIYRILKEGRGFNLGDGKFSGIPNFRKKGREHIKEMMVSHRKIETFGEIGDAQYENLGFGNWSQNRRFLSTSLYLDIRPRLCQILHVA